MKTIRDGILLNKIGLTVYSPDTYNSNLAKQIDCFIINKIKLTPEYREVIMHDENSIKRFYEPIVSNNPNLELVVQLFTSGPSLLTIWSGDNAISKLISIKGKSHPKLAEDNTIRGNFWCDNKVCNLVHTSDSNNEMYRELESIQKKSILELPFLNNDMNFNRVESDYNFHNSNNSMISHNGMFIFAYCIARLLKKISGVNLNIPKLPENGNSKATYEVLVNYFTLIKDYDIENVSIIINKFLLGDTSCIKLLADSIELTTWEEFIIKCSINSMNIWNL